MTGIFLGYYMPWDGLQNAIFAQSLRLRDLDQHHRGLARATTRTSTTTRPAFTTTSSSSSSASAARPTSRRMHVRRGRLSRADALELVKRHDGRFPWTYLGKPIEEVLAQHRHDVRRVHARSAIASPTSGCSSPTAAATLVRDDRTEADQDQLRQRMSLVTAIVDYGMCNLDSVARAFEEVRRSAVRDRRPGRPRAADRIVLARRRCVPGCDAQPARDGARPTSLGEAGAATKQRPFLGVCLGMQLMAAIGVEGGETDGLGWIRRRRRAARADRRSTVASRTSAGTR